MSAAMSAFNIATNNNAVNFGWQKLISLHIKNTEGAIESMASGSHAQIQVIKP